MLEVEFPGVFRLQRFTRTSALQPIFELDRLPNSGRLKGRASDENPQVHMHSVLHSVLYLVLYAHS